MPGMTDDGRELRRHSHFGLATGDGGRYQVALGEEKFPVRSRLREVDFQFEGHELRGVEQNAETGSRWADWRGKEKVMQVLKQRRYVVDGKVQFYGHAALRNSVAACKGPDCQST